MICFTLPQESDVTLSVFNMLWQRVVTLAQGRLPAGEHSFEFDASEQPTGIYFYRLKADAFTEVKKMVLTK